MPRITIDGYVDEHDEMQFHFSVEGVYDITAKGDTGWLKRFPLGQYDPTEVDVAKHIIKNVLTLALEQL